MRAEFEAASDVHAKLSADRVLHEDEGEGGRLFNCRVGVLRRTEILDCLYVMETGLRYFFMRAQAARNVKGNEAVVRANMLEAVSIA